MRVWRRDVNGLEPLGNVILRVEGGLSPMPSPSAPGVPVESQREPQLATLGWALRRAALGLVILLAAVALGAWLFNASIEGAPSQSEYALPQN